MYHIIGSDQKEYGPVSAELIRQWAAEGRVHRATAARPAKETEWKTLGTLPEFAESFPPPAGLTPPTPTATENCGLATAALVCGALGFVTCVSAPVGLVLGFMAHSRIRSSNGRLTGSGLATAGIVLSLIVVLVGLLGFMAGLLLPALAKAKERSQTIACISNGKQLALGLILFANSNTNRLPSASSWCDSVATTMGSPSAFLCVKEDASQRSHYGFNARLDGIEMSEIKILSLTVMIFEIDGGWNVSGGPERMLKSSRHGRQFVVGFADGHVESVNEARLQQLRWDP